MTARPRVDLADVIDDLIASTGLIPDRQDLGWNTHSGKRLHKIVWHLASGDDRYTECGKSVPQISDPLTLHHGVVHLCPICETRGRSWEPAGIARATARANEFVGAKR